MDSTSLLNTFRDYDFVADLVESFTLSALLSSLIGIYFLSLIVFWFKSREVKKDSNSIFDQWFIATFVMLIWGRITYLYQNWESISDVIWFWAPYERYGDQVLWFRTMPWRILDLSDGGFLLIPMFVVFLAAHFVYVVIIKKWKWRKMMLPVVSASNAFTGFVLFLIGLLAENETYFVFGLTIGLITIIFDSILYGLNLFFAKKSESFNFVIEALIFLYVLVNGATITYILTNSNLSSFEDLHVYAFAILNIFILIAYMLDLPKVDAKSGDIKKKELSEISLNQAIKVRNDE